LSKQLTWIGYGGQRQSRNKNADKYTDAQYCADRF